MIGNRESLRQLDMIDVVGRLKIADGGGLAVLGRHPAIHRAAIPLRVRAFPGMIGILIAELREMEGMIGIAGAIAIAELRRIEAERGVLAAAELRRERAEIMIEGAILLAEDHDMLDRR